MQASFRRFEESSSEYAPSNDFRGNILELIVILGSKALKVSDWRK